jgi:hypothetical protein
LVSTLFSTFENGEILPFKREKRVVHDILVFSGLTFAEAK